MLLAACSAVVVVDAPPDLRPVWDELLREHPLPGGLEVRIAVPGGRKADLELRFARTAGAADSAPGSGEERSREVLGRWLVPAVPLTSEVFDVASFAALPPDAELVLLENVALPMRAVSVAGLFPGEPGYSLRERMRLTLRSRRGSLLRWFESMPAGLGGGDTPELAWIGAVGDVMPARGVDQALLSGGLEAVFGDTLWALRAPHLLAGNLECALTRRGTPQSKAYTFRADPQVLLPLDDAGFDYLSLTNNHAFDYGGVGFADTLDALARYGLATSGAGSTRQEALLPYRHVIGNLEIRVFSLGAYPGEASGFDGRSTTATGTRPGVLWADEGTIAQICSLFSPQSLDVVLVHGGQEWASRPTASQQALYRGLAARGADLLIGSHPHVLQGMVVLDGSLVVHSLGNFLFPGMDETGEGTRSIILSVGVYRGRIVALRCTPVELRAGTVRLGDESIVRRFLALSREMESP